MSSQLEDHDESEPELRLQVFADASRHPREQDARLLIRALADDDPQIRRYAVIGLDRLNDPSAASHVARLLADPTPTVRRRVCAFLLKHPEPDAIVQPLVDILLDATMDMAARDFAAMTLASGGHRQALPAIIHTLTNGPVPLRRRLVHALMRMPDRNAIAALRHVVQDSSTDDRTRLIAQKVLTGLMA